MTINVKNYKLSEEPKKGATLKGGKADGYIIKKISVEKKWYGTITYLFLENPKKHLKRIVSYNKETKKIGDFQQGFLTATKGKYYLTWQ